MLGKIWKSSAGKVWMIVGAALIVLALVVSILLSTVFYDVVGLVFGRRRPIYAEGIVSMYPALNSTSKEEAFANSNALNIDVCEEGFVLLKNGADPASLEDDALPLTRGARVSVFGKNSVDLSYGGSGSGGFSGVSYKTIYDSLEDAGFVTNPELKAFYEDESRSGAKREPNSDDLDSGGNQMIATAETPQSRYDDVTESYDDYSDAAIVVITRIGGEGFDLPRYQGTTEGAASPDSHYLELDANEIDLLRAVTAEDFDKVIVVFNIPSSFEATFLEVGDLADDIDAAVWTGFTGGEGIMALGSILNGTVSPSGRLVDTWAKDFTKDPTFVNFGTGPTPDDSDKYDFGNYYFVHYEESAYVGYRYYETRGFTEGEEWYENNVLYPFGYGLSYTEFEWSAEQPATTEITKDGRITVEVTVTNTGDVAGKDVVQLYVTPPYYEIERPHKILAGYAKTDLLQPGASDTVEITLDPYDIAAYDYRNANDNDVYGYEVEAGDYELHISRNAHESVMTVDCRVATGFAYEQDPDTQADVYNRFTDNIDAYDSDYDLSVILSRSAWDATWPTKPTAEDRARGAEYELELTDLNHNNPEDYSNEQTRFGVPVGYDLRSLLPTETPETTYEPIVPYGGEQWDERWNALVSANTAGELEALFNRAAYETQPLMTIGLPATIHGDGPAGFTCFMNRDLFRGTCHWCSEPVMAATWNSELLEEIGRTMGEEGVWGNDGQPYSSIYAPGLNIHRSPFGGRCSEYFSEDPFLSGSMGAAEVRGLQSMGVIPMIKHFVANEQETHRSLTGDSTWLTEQALREIYLKPFEMAVKDGKARGLMTSFNRIGTRWTGGDYRLLTEILRGEWGFEGVVICDFNTIPQYMNSRQMAYAGGDLNLATQPVSWYDASDPSDSYVLQRCARNVIYAFTNSNAMNGKVIGYRLPVWQIVMIVIDCVIVVGIAVWGFFVVRAALKKPASSDDEVPTAENE